LALSRCKLVGCAHLLRQEAGNFLARPRRCELEGFVNVDIALGHSPGGVTQQGGDRQFGKSEVASDAAERMAQSVRADPFDFRGGAKPGKAALGGSVMAVADIGREEIRTIFAGRLASRELGSGRPARVAAWRERDEAAGRSGVAKIGLVFHANPASASAGQRSIPLADLAPTSARADVGWVNLEGGAAGRELAAAHPEIIDATKEEVPLDEFAAEFAATDILVSVDTMAAHCAGALGHPLLLLAPYSPH
jgi:hypothetical protein